MNEKPDWFKVISAHQKLRGGIALSITFLIGAQRALHVPKNEEPISPDQARVLILSLLQCFVENTPEDYFVSIYRCEKFNHQPFATLLKNEDCQDWDGIFLETNSSGRKTVQVSEDFASDGSVSLSSLADQLWQELISPICEARFTCTTTDYIPFSADDKKVIEQARCLENLG